jgi:hypothetical protein
MALESRTRTLLWAGLLFVVCIGTAWWVAYCFLQP